MNVWTVMGNRRWMRSCLTAAGWLVCLAVLPLGCGRLSDEPTRSELQALVNGGPDAGLKKRVLEGRMLFVHYCAVCHNATGQGDGPNAFNLDPKPRNLTDRKFRSARTDEQLHEVISRGGRGAGKSPSMPAWGKTLHPAQIKKILAFIRSLPLKG